MPAELALRVFDDGDLATADRLRYLALCKSLHGPALTALYMTIDVHTQAAAADLVRIVATRPDRAILVRSLAIECPEQRRPPWIGGVRYGIRGPTSLSSGTDRRRRASIPLFTLSVLSYLPKVRHVSLAKCDLIQAPTHPISSVRHLELADLEETRGWSYETVVGFVRSFAASLKALTIRNAVQAVYTRGLTEILAISSTRSDLFTHLPLTLRHITFDNVSVLHALRIAFYCYLGDRARSPALESVEVGADYAAYSWGTEGVARVHDICAKRGLAFRATGALVPVYVSVPRIAQA